MESLSRANSAFALDLYRAISAGSPDGNLFFSPLSISAALSMVLLGARGATAEEMAKVWEFILNTTLIPYTIPADVWGQHVKTEIECDL